MARLALSLAFCIAVSIAAASQVLTTIVNFGPGSGSNPESTLIQDASGNLYGTTFVGGVDGMGTVFSFLPNGTLTTLHSFLSSDGAYPECGLAQGSDGNFYGTAANGGSNGQGTVFKITSQGSFSTLYNFNSTDGVVPYGGLVQANDGNFYGTTTQGGDNAAGVVFQMTPQGSLTVIHSFNYDDGYEPTAALVQGTDGNLYGTTLYGGVNKLGVVFAITPDGVLTVLHKFAGADGFQPYAGLVQASDGNFYGTTQNGGDNDVGTVFRITPSGTLTTLHSFARSDGAYPNAALVQATNGKLYGTTQNGGAHLDAGTMFSITLDGTLTKVYDFCSIFTTSCIDGRNPAAGLLQALDGSLYGTTYAGGPADLGTAFSLDLGLGVSLSVNTLGGGTVSSRDGEINCGTTCSAEYRKGYAVTLTATPAFGWQFGSWVGCDQSQANVCTLAMNQSRQVTATFTNAPYSLFVSKSGNGLITSGDNHIYCGGVCSYSYNQGAHVGLTAIPAAGYSFSSWNGCDQVQGQLCVLQMSTARSVTAAFTKAMVTLTSLTFNPSYVKGGQLSVGTLTLGGPAPSGGVSVALSSDHPSVVHPPSLVIVPGGKSSVVFGVNTYPVKSNTMVMITATAGSSQVSGTLTVGTTSLPPSLR